MKSTILIFLSLLCFGTHAGAKTILEQSIEDNVEIKISYAALINSQLRNSDLCKQEYTPTRMNKSGTKPVKMLAYAYVLMGPSSGSGRYGHSGERFIYCIGETLYDVYYDGIKLTEMSTELFKDDYAGTTDKYLNKKLMGSLYLREIHFPTRNTLYGFDTIFNNRNIYEQWLDITEDEIYSLLEKNISRRNIQSEKVKNQKKLPTFRGLLNNCTYTISMNLQTLPTLQNIKLSYKVQKPRKGPGKMIKYKSLTKYLNTVQPKAIFNALGRANITKLLVIYPSQLNTREILNNDLSINEQISLLEVPSYFSKLKRSNQWLDIELEQIQKDFKDYKSPLIEELEQIISI